jgi:hypothetical protein
MHVDLTLKDFRCPNTTVQECEANGRSYVQCGPFSEHYKSKKHCLLKDLESSLVAWLQAYAYDAIHGTTTLGPFYFWLLGSDKLYGFQ